MSVKTVSMVKIKTLKHCENLLKVSDEIKRLLNLINNFEQVFPI